MSKSNILETTEKICVALNEEGWKNLTKEFTRGGVNPQQIHVMHIAEFGKHTGQRIVKNLPSQFQEEIKKQ